MTMHRTAQGRMVDMASLAAKHEKVRAVGNMNVNARGDTLNEHNKVIQEQSQRVNATYKRSMENRRLTRAETTRPSATQTITAPHGGAAQVQEQFESLNDDFDDGYDEKEVAQLKAADSAKITETPKTTKTGSKSSKKS